MRRVQLGGQGVRMWTPPLQRAETTPPKREKITGWTKGAAQRNRAFLISADPTLLAHDLGYAVTLTLGATPLSAEIWGEIIHRFLVTLRRCGMIRYHWVTEWTKKGRPHLHLTFFLKGREPILPDTDRIFDDTPASTFAAMRNRASGPWQFIKKPWLDRYFFKVIGPFMRTKPASRGIPVSQ